MGVGGKGGRPPAAVAMVTSMHMLPFIVGGFVFVLLGLTLALFRKRWSMVFARLDNYAKVPAQERRSRPMNFLVVGTVWGFVGVGWVVIALLNQPWR